MQDLCSPILDMTFLAPRISDNYCQLNDKWQGVSIFNVVERIFGKNVKLVNQAPDFVESLTISWFIPEKSQKQYLMTCHIFSAVGIRTHQFNPLICSRSMIYPKDQVNIFLTGVCPWKQKKMYKLRTVSAIVWAFECDDGWEWYATIQVKAFITVGFIRVNEKSPWALHNLRKSL